MEKVSYTSEYITDVKELCRRISTGFQYFTREEKRRTYELLDLQARLAVEDGLKVVYVRCVLNQQRLSIQHSNRRHIASSSSR